MSSSSFPTLHKAHGGGSRDGQTRSVTVKPKLKISAQDLMCKNNCGHYGNEVQEGYCSVCYRMYKQQQQIRQQHLAAVVNANSSGTSPAKEGSESFGIFGRSPISSGLATLPKAAKLSLDSLSSPLSGFAKFEEKKRHQAGHKSKSFRSVFRKSPSPSLSPDLNRSGSGSSGGKELSNSLITQLESPKISPHKPNQQDGEREEIRNEINTFLLQFPKQIVHDVVVKVKQCEAELSRACRSNAGAEEISDIAQDFYRNFKGKVDIVPCYQSMTTEDRETLMDLIEKYLTVSLYKEVFTPNSTAAEDETRDLTIQNKIRGLNWITCKHLDVALNERDQHVRDLVFQAINAIIGMDSLKAPQDKLACITQCSRHILEALGMSKQAPTSADDFLPTLIYIVIKANPTRLQSNINFINRFCNAARLMSGEDGYFFTNMCCAVSFIQNMKGESLGIPEEEFEDYVSGKSIPSETWDNYFSESLHNMEEMSGVLDEMKTRHEEFLKNVDNLREMMQQKQDWVSEQVDVTLQRTPLTFKTPKKPTNIDEEDPGLQQPTLPEPLQPEVVNLHASAKEERICDKSSTTVQSLEVKDSAVASINGEADDSAHSTAEETEPLKKESLSSPTSGVDEFYSADSSIDMQEKSET